MNKGKLTNLCHTVSKETGLTFNSVLLYYFLEDILKKLAQGKYSKHLVFKGGFLLSNVVGVSSRSTVDIDFVMQNLQLSVETISEMLYESLGEKLGSDGIQYEIQEIKPIREDDQYGGFRVKILCKLDNIRQVVPLDIVTGDVITPGPLDYQYTNIFGDELIAIKAYPIETMIAEKLHTIWARGFLNSRSKDFYDLYILYKLKRKLIKFPILITACERTFLYRKSEFDLSKLSRLLETIKIDETFIGRWDAYTKKNEYAKDIRFDIVIDGALQLIKEMELLKK